MLMDLTRNSTDFRALKNSLTLSFANSKSGLADIRVKDGKRGKRERKTKRLKTKDK